MPDALKWEIYAEYDHWVKPPKFIRIALKRGDLIMPFPVGFLRVSEIPKMQRLFNDLMAACYLHAASRMKAAAETGVRSDGTMRFDGGYSWETPVEWLKRLAQSLEGK